MAMVHGSVPLAAGLFQVTQPELKVWLGQGDRTVPRPGCRLTPDHALGELTGTGDLLVAELGRVLKAHVKPPNVWTLFCARSRGLLPHRQVGGTHLGRNGIAVALKQPVPTVSDLAGRAV